MREAMQFAHSSLVRLLEPWRRGDKKLSWRRVSRREQFTNIGDFRSAVLKGMDEKIVHLVLDIRPQMTPDFVFPL